MKTKPKPVQTSAALDHCLTPSAIRKRGGKYTVKLTNVGNPDYRQDPNRPLPDTFCAEAHKVWTRLGLFAAVTSPTSTWAAATGTGGLESPAPTAWSSASSPTMGSAWEIGAEDRDDPPMKTKPIPNLTSVCRTNPSPSPAETTVDGDRLATDQSAPTSADRATSERFSNSPSTHKPISRCQTMKTS